MGQFFSTCPVFKGVNSCSVQGQIRYPEIKMHDLNQNKTLGVVTLTIKKQKVRLRTNCIAILSEMRSLSMHCIELMQAFIAAILKFDRFAY